MFRIHHTLSCVPLLAVAYGKASSVTNCSDGQNSNTNAQRQIQSSPLHAEVIFLGSGSSTGMPVLRCLMDESYKSRQCITSIKAAQGDPRHNKNYRCNPSLVLRVHHPDKTESILFDAGKTFREASIRWFPKHKITSIDACVLTHGHADAILGLDDIRGIQNANSDTPLLVYLTQDTLDIVKRTFFYLFPSGQLGHIQRHIARLQFHTIEPWKEVTICGVPIIPIPVKHGEDMINVGFIIGKQHKFCYISDVSRIPKRTMDYLMSLDLDLLIIDALFKKYRHSTHISLDEAIDISKQLKPKQVLLLGLSGEFDYDIDNALLQELSQQIGIDIQLSYDGLKVELDI